MSRAKAPPRIKGPYSERGGTRFRIRICDAAGRRDLYFPTRKEALNERQDVMALAAVTALLLGCRASEVLRVRVRDLDCGGTRLWIAARDSEYQGKTANATRDPDIPEVLRPRLLKLTAAPAPDAYLFGLSSTGKPKSRQLLHSTVRRLCRAAGVPVVCPHSVNFELHN